MTIDQLFRAFTDADFQYKRFMKIKVFESDTLSRFDALPMTFLFTQFLFKNHLL